MYWAPLLLALLQLDAGGSLGFRTLQRLLLLSARLHTLRAGATAAVGWRRQVASGFGKPEWDGAAAHQEPQQGTSDATPHMHTVGAATVSIHLNAGDSKAHAGFHTPTRLSHPEVCIVLDDCPGASGIADTDSCSPSASAMRAKIAALGRKLPAAARGFLTRSPQQDSHGGC